VQGYNNGNYKFFLAVFFTRDLPTDVQIKLLLCVLLLTGIKCTHPERKLSTKAPIKATGNKISNSFILFSEKQFEICFLK